MGYEKNNNKHICENFILWHGVTVHSVQYSILLVVHIVIVRLAD
jgi:hypothetical protein